MDTSRAPTYVEFYARDWTEIGTKRSLVTHIHKRTSIPPEVLLRENSFNEYSAGERLSWAADRITTREEDMAYCLLGMFDINMPLLYGERSKAFYGLQEEIIRSSGDLSLLLLSAHPGRSYSETAHRDVSFLSPGTFN
jgi:hypothetical protein